MRLLVSVRDGADAAAALAGGADVIDAKDPAAGALGAVTHEALLDIHRVVGRDRPVTAALGDATTEQSIEEMAFSFASAGAEFVKVGFSGTTSVTRVAALIRSAARGATAGSGGACGVVAVAYADAAAESVSFFRLMAIAASAGATGVLIDTADKRGPGLCGLIDRPTLASWARSAHAEGLLVAAAGQLTHDDLPFIREAGADIVGFRGAVCEGGRVGRVSREKVHALHALVSQRQFAGRG